MSLGLGAYGRGEGWDMWQGVGVCGGMWQGVGACGRGWGHVAGDGGMWQEVTACRRGWICENMTNVKKSKMLTMNEVHKMFYLTK